MDYNIAPQPKIGCSQGLHTQESGDAGLSSNMEHKFSDSYNENAPHVEDKGSFVVPFRDEEGDFNGLGMAKHMLHSSACEHPASTKRGESKPHFYPVADDGGSLEAYGLPVVEKNIFSPQPMPPTESTPEEKVNTTGSEDETWENQTSGGDSYIAESVMETGYSDPEPPNQPRVPRKVRKGNRLRKTSGWRNWKLYLVTFILLATAPTTEGSAAKCWNCMDKEKCPKLLTIYDDNDTQLYTRDRNQVFPRCTGSTDAGSSPTLKSCTVCFIQDNITIICSNGVGNLEVETDSDPIQDIRPVSCDHPQLCASAALIFFSGLFLIVFSQLEI